MIPLFVLQETGRPPDSQVSLDGFALSVAVSSPFCTDKLTLHVKKTLAFWEVSAYPSSGVSGRRCNTSVAHIKQAPE